MMKIWRKQKDKGNNNSKHLTQITSVKMCWFIQLPCFYLLYIQMHFKANWNILFCDIQLTCWQLGWIAFGLGVKQQVLHKQNPPYHPFITETFGL